MHPLVQRTLSGVWLPNYSGDCITCSVPLPALCTGKSTCPDWPLSFTLCTASVTCISDQGGRETVTDQNFKWVKSSVQTKELNSIELCLLWRVTGTFPKAPNMNKICFYLLLADFMEFAVFDKITHKCCLCCHSSFICGRFHNFWSNKEERATGSS